MVATSPKQRPIRIPSRKKRAVRTQFGALCYRIRNDKVQVLLVTSRRTRRWIVPKGWPMHGVTPQKAALQEAWEEAGVEGRVKGASLGMYSYTKLLQKKKVACVVVLFAVKVRKTKKNYPEVGERRRKWMSRKKAAAMVNEPELKQIIRAFEPEDAAPAPDVSGL